jgi:hypothetical protein
MKASINSSRFRLGVLLPLLCAYLCLFVGTDAVASDPDDDWGLPTLIDSGDDDSGSSSGGDSDNIQIGFEVDEGQLDQVVGMLFADLEGNDETGFEDGVAPKDAEIAPVMSSSASEPVVVQPLGDGLAMQGQFLLKLAYKGEGPLKATIRSPADAVNVAALLTVDNLGSIEELLADPSGTPAGVSTLLPVGQVAVVNLNAFQKLVDTYGDLLGAKHVSVIVLSTDSDGELHVSAARMDASGGPMEVLIR